MDRRKFERHLEKVVNCPHLELEKDFSICANVIIPHWTNLIGWGNPSAKVLFIGVNPRFDDSALAWHTPKQGDSNFEHALKRSCEGASHDKHFWYQKRILEELKSYGEDLKINLPETIGEFAFFTEVAFCPSKNEGGLKKKIFKYCFNRNTKDFVLNPSFEVVITLESIPAKVLIESFIGKETAKNLSYYHGKYFEIPDINKVVITSYHPNAHPKENSNWDRSAVSKCLYELYKRKVINLF